MTTEPRRMADAWTASVARMVVRLSVLVGLAIGAVYALMRMRSLIVMLFVAIILAYIIRPIAGWLATTRLFRRVHDGLVGPFLLLLPSRVRPRAGLSMRVRRVIASLYVLVLLFVGSWYSARFLLSPFTTEIRNVQENWETYRSRVEGYERDLRAWYRTHVKPEYRRWLEAQFKGAAGNGGVNENAAAWLGLGLRRTSEYVLYVVELVLMPVLAFYFSVESRQLKHEFVGLLPRRRRRDVLRMISDFNDIMFSFVVCQAVLCLIAGLVVGIGLALLGVPYPVSLGVLAGITRAIPIIGPIFGGIPIVLLALVTKGLAVAVGVLIFFSILHFVESKFIMPLLIGDSLSLHPVVIIMVLLIGEEFGGLLGMFFAAPVAAIVRVALRRYWLPRADRDVSRIATSMDEAGSSGC